MKDLIIETGIYLLALGLSIIPFFIKKITAGWKLTILLVVFCLIILGAVNAISKHRNDILVEGERKQTNEKLSKVLVADSILSLNYRQLDQSYQDIKLSLKNANLSYDSTKKTIINNNVGSIIGDVKNANLGPNYGVQQVGDNTQMTVKERMLTRKEQNEIINAIDNFRELNKKEKKVFIFVGTGASGKIINQIKRVIEAHGYTVEIGSVSNSFEGFHVDSYIEPLQSHVVLYLGVYN